MGLRPSQSALLTASQAWVDALEPRRLLSSSSSPKLSLDRDLTVPAGQTIQIPISGTAAHGRALAYKVNSAGDGLTATFHATTNTWLDLSTSLGTMRFQLFDDLTPETAARIRGLAEGGFYDGLSFHRVVNVGGFRIAQTGSPNGDGTGGPDATFDDEFNPDLIFDTPGLLAMANPGNSGETSKDANRSQFFVTGSEARSLDFNHTIFGILVRGGKTLDTILAAQTDANYKPTSTITVKSARVVEDTTDAVLQVRADTSKPGARKLTLTATDTAKKSRKEQITINVVADTTGTPPILAPIPSIYYREPGAFLKIPVRAIGLALNEYEINGNITEGGAGVVKAELNDADKTLDLTLDPSYTGPVKITVGVKGVGAVSRGGITLQPGQPPTDLSLYDTQSFTVSVGSGEVSGSAPQLLHAYPNIKLDGQLIATFKTTAQAAQASDFSAKVEWGDGAVTSAADVRPLSDGSGFGVYATHTYSRATNAAIPLRVRVASSAGADLALKSAVVVSDEVHVDDETGVLRIEGSNDDDDVWLSVEDDQLVIRIANDEQRVALNRVKQIIVELFGGNDKLTIDRNVPGASIDGGDGDDVIDAGDGADTIDGGAGNDRITANGGEDLVHGGDGNDSILGGSGKNKLFGDAGDDRLTGSAGPDQLSGGDGNDKLYGRAGDDLLDGGGGSDRLYGEDGNDRLIGGGSNDRLYAGAGNDTLYGNAGGDTLDGGEDDDTRGDNDEMDVIRSL